MSLSVWRSSGKMEVYLETERETNDQFFNEKARPLAIAAASRCFSMDILKTIRQFVYALKFISTIREALTTQYLHILLR